MALYFIQQPHKYHPAYNDIIFVTSGTNNTQTNYQYILDVWLTGASSYSKRFKVPARPDGYGVFDISEFIRQYITQDISISSTEGFKQCTNSYKSYDIKLGEEYGTSGTVYASLTTSGTYYAYNSIFDPLDYVDYNDNDYVLADSTKEFLTNHPNKNNSSNGIPIKSTENAWLHFITSGTNIAYEMRVETNLDSYTITNDFATVTDGDDMFLKVPAGVNLNDIPPGKFTSGSPPIIKAGVTNYNITIRKNSVPLNASETVYFKINDVCSKYDSYRLHFLNKPGGGDSFTFNAVSKQSATIDRQKYKRMWGQMSGSNWVYSKSDKQEQTFSTIIKDKLILNSDWITESESTWLEELVTSPVVYWDNDGTLIPIEIINSGYERKKVENEKMFNLVIEAEFTYTRNRQG